jgi:hypothetical protein
MRIRLVALAAVGRILAAIGGIVAILKQQK